MAPAVPFALLGVVQLTAVAVWLAFAAAAWLPQNRRVSTPVVAAGAVAMAVADALTALRLNVAVSNGLGDLRVAGLAALAVGLGAGTVVRRRFVAAGIVVPLGVQPSTAVFGVAAGVLAAGAVWLRGGGNERRRLACVSLGLLLTAAAAGLAAPARTSSHAALALLGVRAAASVVLFVAVALMARENLLAKLVGSIVAGVVAMAVGAVAVVGTGVAGEVQRDQSARLLSVATAQEQAMQTLATRAGLFAQIVAQCPTERAQCIGFLNSFSDDPDFFAVIARPSDRTTEIAPAAKVLGATSLHALAGSAVVRAALQRSATAQTVASGPVLLPGSPGRLAVVAAVPSRPSAKSVVGSSPKYAAVYGIELGDRYLTTREAATGYDFSIVDAHGLLSTSLGQAGERQVLNEASTTHVADAGPTATSVQPAEGRQPTIAFVPIAAAGNDNVRLATLAVSQPASVALETERSVLRRLVLTALVVLLVVALLAVGLARRIVDPVRRLTVAAGRVRRGDLDATVAVVGHDEVGLLARAFDAMTLSLRALTGDLRQSAEAETATRTRLETVLLSMTDGLLTTQADGRLVGSNPVGLQLLAMEESDVLGRPLGEVVRLRGADGVEVDLGGDAVRTFSAVLLRADGGELAVAVSIAPIVGTGGQLVVLSDRTREREVERMKTEFLSNVSHELRTPLTPIRGYAEMLARRPDLPTDTRQGFVGEILSGTTRMNRVVDLLVDVAALEAGRMVSRQRRIALGGFVDERLEEWRARYPRRAADLKRRVTPRLPGVDVDPVWLAKALDELVDNATKYTRPGTPITIVATRSDEGGVRLAVRDSGEGIDTSRLGELMGDFSQADASATRRVGGLGLGLSFVSRVAQQLGMTLSVTSAPGRGAEFALDLPSAGALDGAALGSTE